MHHYRLKIDIAELEVRISRDLLRSCFWDSFLSIFVLSLFSLVAFEISKYIHFIFYISLGVMLSNVINSIFNLIIWVINYKHAMQTMRYWEDAEIKNELNSSTKIVLSSEH